MAGIQGFSQADRLELVKRYAPDEFAPGRDVRGEFGHLAQLDSQGRRKALAGFVIRATMSIGSSANGGNDVSYFDMLAYFRNFRLRALGIPLFEGDLDARHLQDDVRLRLGRDAPGFVNGGNDSSAPSNGSSWSVNIFYPFGNPWAKGSRKNDCAIPLAAMDHRRDPTSRLEFRMGPLPFTADGAVTVTSLELWALTRTELQPLMPALPRLIETRQTQLGDTMERSSLDRDARLEYAVIRHMLEDRTDSGGDYDGDQLVADYAGISVRHGQDQWLVSEDAESAQMALMNLYPNIDLMFVRGTVGACLPLVANPPRSDISDGAAYPITWSITSRDGAPFTRILRRERITLRTVEQQAMAVVQGVSPTEAVPETKTADFAASTVTPEFVTRRIKVLPPAPAPAAGRRVDRRRPRPGR